MILQLFENLLSFENLFAFLALAVMEIVLGIDNLVYISIVSGKLPVDQQPSGPTDRITVGVGYPNCFVVCIVFRRDII